MNFHLSLGLGNKWVLLVNPILYCTFRQLSSRTSMIKNGTLYSFVTAKLATSTLRIKSGNSSFSWDRPTSPHVLPAACLTIFNF